jgi:hypothetical protein
MKIVHCPTEIMLADFYTKPLQGALFRKFRDVVLGQKPVSSLRDDLDSSRLVTEERVGESRSVESDRVEETDRRVTWSLVEKYPERAHGNEGRVGHRDGTEKTSRGRARFPGGEVAIKLTSQSMQGRRNLQSSYFETIPS